LAMREKMDVLQTDEDITEERRMMLRMIVTEELVYDT